MGGITGKLSFESGEVVVCPAPATNESGSVFAVAEASLTNASSLRSLLEDRHHTFSTTTDSELVVHAFEEWGARCFEQFRGAFACAIWDGTQRRLVIARDHLGLRPLYFSLLHGQGVVFASEVAALLQDPAVGREWCPSAIDAYLTLGYVPAPSSAFRRISKLEPAHTLTVEGRRLQVRRYWDLSSQSASAPRDAVAALEGSLHAAMTAHVAQAGILYSGGPASTALLAVTPRNEGTPVTVRLDEDSSDLTRSDRAAIHMHRTRELEFGHSPVEPLVKALAAQCGEPLADPAGLTHLMVLTAASRHGSVLFTGDGAAVLWSGRSRDGRHRAEHDLWGGHRRRAIYTRGFAWEVRNANPYQRHTELAVAAGNDGAVDRALYVDARTCLSDNEVATADRAAQAAGVTLRFPFLALPLVELAVTLPSSAKVHGHTGMQPLRTLLARSLPAALLPPARPTARHAWLEGALGALVPALLLGPRFDGRGVVSRLALSHLWDEYLAGIGDHSYRLWSLVMLELWFRQFVDGDAAVEEPYEYAVVKAA